jgi:hypothetical protein
VARARSGAAYVQGETVLGRLASVPQLKLRRIGPEIHEILSELTRAWHQRDQLRQGFLLTMGTTPQRAYRSLIEA